MNVQLPPFPLKTEFRLMKFCWELWPLCRPRVFYGGGGGGGGGSVFIIEKVVFIYLRECKCFSLL